jgi:hypothetical protein
MAATDGRVFEDPRTVTRVTLRYKSPIWLRGVKYTFVTATEACVDPV